MLIGNEAAPLIYIFSSIRNKMGIDECSTLIRLVDKSCTHWMETTIRTVHQFGTKPTYYSYKYAEILCRGGIKCSKSSVSKVVSPSKSWFLRHWLS
jgi:hypothetical protein